MFFARGDTLCNDTTELSAVEFHNILSAAFAVPALKSATGIKEISETARSFGADMER
jgi:hypothetical protein